MESALNRTLMNTLVAGLMGGSLLACGGGDPSSPASTTALLATTAVCYAPWSPATAYSGGATVSYNGVNYRAAYWTQGSNPSTNSGPVNSGQPWITDSVCGGGTTPTPTPDPGGSFAGLSKAQFESWFPSRSSFYQYADFVAAAAYYPSFAKSGNATLDKQEVAAFFANLQHESDNLKAVREYNTANWPLYCDVNWVQVPCKSNNVGDQYFGRGPIQISWTSNYRSLGNAMGLGEQLVNNPELLATNATIAWRSAIWYWMTQPGRAGRSAHDSMVGGYGFGQTINAINGNRECVGGTAYQGPAQMQTRVNYYTTFTQNLGVPTGPNLSC